MGPLSTRVFELAQTFLGDAETGNNDAPWLRTLMANAKELPWHNGESYCIGSLCALFDIACKEQDRTLPFPTSLSTRAFYEGAKALHWTSNGAYPIYEPGDIAIFSDGNSWQGHAAFVVAASKAGISTIEFNTSNDEKGSQRNGGGCYPKMRLFSEFGVPDAHHLWLRGAVKTSKL